MFFESCKRCDFNIFGVNKVESNLIKSALVWLHYQINPTSVQIEQFKRDSCLLNTNGWFFFPTQITLLHYLGGDIVRGPTEGLGGDAVLHVLFAHAEVGDLDVTLAVQHHVVQLQVPASGVDQTGSERNGWCWSGTKRTDAASSEKTAEADKNVLTVVYSAFEIEADAVMAFACTLHC